MLKFQRLCVSVFFALNYLSTSNQRIGLFLPMSNLVRKLFAMSVYMAIYRFHCERARTIFLSVCHHPSLCSAIC